MKRKAYMDPNDLDWKSKLEPDIRPTQVARILDTLKICFPSCASVNLAELTKMAEWFEQEMFDVATCFGDYWNKVLERTLSMPKKLKPDASDDMQSQGQSQISLPNQPQAQQHQNVQNTTVRAGAQSFTSFLPALPSMTHLTQTLLPNASGKRINMQSGIAQNFVGSSDSQGLPSVMQSHIPQQSQQPPQNLLQPTQMSNAAGQRWINMQSGIAQNFVGSSDSQGLPSVMQSHIPQQSQQPPQNLLQPTQMLNAAGQRWINMQSGIAQNFVGSSDSQGLPSVMQTHIPQQSQQQPQNLLQLTQMSNVAGQRRINMQSGIAQNFVGSSVRQGLPPVMHSRIPQQSQQQPQNLLQPNQMLNAAGQRRINMQSGIAQNFVGSSVRQGLPPVMHSGIPQQSQQQPQNLLQPTQMLNVAGRSTNTQSAIAQNSVRYVTQGFQGVPSNINSNAHAQYLLQQHNPQQHNPQLSSSSMNSNAQTGQNAVDWHEEIYQRIQTMNKKYLPYLNVIYEKISKEYQQSPQGEGQAVLKSLEQQIDFLNLTKNQISPTWRDRIPEVEKQITSMINSNMPQKPVSAQEQIQQPGGHPLSTQPHQQQQQQ